MPLIFNTFTIFNRIFSTLKKADFVLGHFELATGHFGPLGKVYRSDYLQSRSIYTNIHQLDSTWTKRSLPDSKPKTFFVTLSQPVSECQRISIWRVTVSRLETSLSKCRTSFLKTIEHTLQQQNVISVLNSDAPGMSFLSKFSWAFSSIKFT